MTAPGGTPKDAHYARLRRAHRDAAPQRPEPDAPLRLYGIHTVRQAILNPRRIRHRLLATRNALDRLDLAPDQLEGLAMEETSPRELDRLVGADAVHQGVVLEAEPLETRSEEALAGARLLLVLDQITDPHNVGAILRSAVAFGADAVVTTTRHSPAETGVMAKAASGALDLIDLVAVRNLGDCLERLNAAGHLTLGLDSDGDGDLEAALTGARIALVMGAEGKGLRQRTRETCGRLARIDAPGPIRSLNVSNAAALALYLAHRHLSAG